MTNKHSSADMKIELFQKAIKTLCGHRKGEADDDILTLNATSNLVNIN